ncbi:hypothetical protein JM93_01690 [Roseibium hamelinense]|uniref:Glycosyltransferase n=1 Tax=Roseibium hamelinense TaxID=150831 RepID=A0A562T7D0_9HYPH|nr:glycosyltransferase [Roseibium hamelinense]MTI42821.1 glycosyltransferase [Roseibium hamelinense]TWI89487.1 hypothetical protein JM93_01690 [Roseibium hamelinense]
MHDSVVRVFVGYDRRIHVASSTLAHSITEHSSLPVSVLPLNLRNLKDVFWRDTDPNQSTEFSFSRFLTPYLSGFTGWSIFMDNDIVFLDDIAKLWALRDDRYAVMCVKHDHNPTSDTKFLGEKQTRYEKKNWSSVMLFNNAKCQALTPEYVNSATGLQLHQFKWLDNDDLIGEVPASWNYLAGYTTGVEQPQAIHYTDGGPWYPETEHTEYASEWFKAFKSANLCEVADLQTLLDMTARSLKDAD